MFGGEAELENKKRYLVGPRLAKELTGVAKGHSNQDDAGPPVAVSSKGDVPAAGVPGRVLGQAHPGGVLPLHHEVLLQPSTKTRGDYAGVGGSSRRSTLGSQSGNAKSAAKFWRKGVGSESPGT